MPKTTSDTPPRLNSTITKTIDLVNLTINEHPSANSISGELKTQKAIKDILNTANSSPPVEGHVQQDENAKNKESKRSKRRRHFKGTRLTANKKVFLSRVKYFALLSVFY